MPVILIVTKDGSIREVEISNDVIYHKVAGFRNDNNFLIQNVFTTSLNDIEYKVSLYGKTKGKNVDTNKYVFEPLFKKKLIGKSMQTESTQPKSPSL